MFLTQLLNRRHNIGQNSVFTLLGLHPLSPPVDKEVAQGFILEPLTVSLYADI